MLQTATSAAVAAWYRTGISVRTRAVRLMKMRAPRMCDQMFTVSSGQGTSS